MVFVVRYASPSGICWSIRSGRIAIEPASRSIRSGRIVIEPGKRKYVFLYGQTAGATGQDVECESAEELELRLAAMGLRRRMFPCDVISGWWACYGTEPAL